MLVVERKSSRINSVRIDSNGRNSDVPSSPYIWLGTVHALYRICFLIHPLVYLLTNSQILFRVQGRVTYFAYTLYFSPSYRKNRNSYRLLSRFSERVWIGFKDMNLNHVRIDILVACVASRIFVRHQLLALNTRNGMNYLLSHGSKPPGVPFLVVISFDRSYWFLKMLVRCRRRMGKIWSISWTLCWNLGIWTTAEQLTGSFAAIFTRLKLFNRFFEKKVCEK